MRALISAALVLVLTAPLARAETWTTARYEAMLRDLDKAQEALICDCAAPSPECRALCTAKPGPGWLCGTNLAEMDQQLREALVGRARPEVIEDLIRGHPAPFARMALVKNWKPSPTP